jgi:hypothetical protein
MSPTCAGATLCCAPAMGESVGTSSATSAVVLASPAMSLHGSISASDGGGVRDPPDPGGVGGLWRATLARCLVPGIMTGSVLFKPSKPSLAYSRLYFVGGSGFALGRHLFCWLLFLRGGGHIGGA